MKNTCLALSLSLLSFSTFAGSLETFIRGLQKDLFFTKIDRTLELQNHVDVTAFGFLGQVLSPDAIATYNDYLNTVSIHKENIETVDNLERIKDARIIRGVKGEKAPSISTIFHELGHAELDVFIENNTTSEDAGLNYHYNNNLKPFYKKNFPSFNPKTVFHEHFGYYRTELMEFMYSQVNDTLMNNGYNRYKNSCYLTQKLKLMLKNGVSLKEFAQIHHNDEEFYRKQLGPRFIFVRGKDIDLQSVRGSKAIIDQTNTLFWAYHQTFYGFPMNQKELVKRLNTQSSLGKQIKECRTTIWKAYQGAIRKK